MAENWEEEQTKKNLNNGMGNITCSIDKTLNTFPVTWQ